MNYQIELEKIINKPENKGKKLLLHSCCAPCSSYCLMYLRDYFEITVFYYNPNITEDAEYRKRVAEEERFIKELNLIPDEAFRISYIEGDYDCDDFLLQVKGYENCPEGGDRCKICFEKRLRESAKVAKNGGFDFFTTTLTISPLKNASLLNEIGQKMALEYGVNFLPSDFKKKEGYKKSIELSKEYNLYRQNYCGCIFSKMESEQREQNKKYTEAL